MKRHSIRLTSPAIATAGLDVDVLGFWFGLSSVFDLDGHTTFLNQWTRQFISVFRLVAKFTTWVRTLLFVRFVLKEGIPATRGKALLI